MDLPSAQPTRVLFVVSDLDLQEAFQTILSEEGYELHFVATLDEAVVRTGEIPFDLILADLFEPSSPLILTSAHDLQRHVGATPIGLLATQPRSEEEARAAGFTFVVPMPFDMASFLSQIATALAQHRPGALRPQHVRATPRLAVAPDDLLTVRAEEVLSRAADLRALAGERLAWIRDLQADAHGVGERAAVARQDAQVARSRAGAVGAAAHEVWIRVQALADATRERARAVRRRAG